MVLQNLQLCPKYQFSEKNVTKLWVWIFVAKMLWFLLFFELSPKLSKFVNFSIFCWFWNHSFWRENSNYTESLAFKNSQISSFKLLDRICDFLTLWTFFKYYFYKYHIVCKQSNGGQKAKKGIKVWFAHWSAIYAF